MDAKRAAQIRRGAQCRATLAELEEASDMATQALEAWVWVERAGAVIRRSQADGWECVVLDWSRSSRSIGPTPLAAVLGAMEKEGKG